MEFFKHHSRLQHTVITDRHAGCEKRYFLMGSECASDICCVKSAVDVVIQSPYSDTDGMNGPICVIPYNPLKGSIETRSALDGLRNDGECLIACCVNRHRC